MAEFFYMLHYVYKFKYLNTLWRATFNQTTENVVLKMAAGAVDFEDLIRLLLKKSEFNLKFKNCYITILVCFIIKTP